MVNFFDIPIEVRDNIYSLCTGELGHVNAAPLWNEREQERKEGANMALLRTSKQTRAEFQRHIYGKPWLITPGGSPFLATTDRVKTVLLKLHYLDGLSDPACHRELDDLIRGHGEHVSKAAQRNATHDHFRRCNVRVWLDKFRAAVRSRAGQVRVDATDMLCQSGCCRLTYELHRAARAQFDAEELKPSRSGKGVRANIATYRGRTVEFEGCEKFEASRLLGVFKLLLEHEYKMEDSE